MGWNKRSLMLGAAQNYLGEVLLMVNGNGRRTLYLVRVRRHIPMRHIPMATYTHETFTHRRHLPIAFIRSQFSLDNYP